MSGPDVIALHERGHVSVYRRAEFNRCPGCGGSQWLVGRSSAECAFCGTALPLHSPSPTTNDQLETEY